MNFVVAFPQSPRDDISPPTHTPEEPTIPDNPIPIPPKKKYREIVNHRNLIDANGRDIGSGKNLFTQFPLLKFKVEKLHWDKVNNDLYIEWQEIKLEGQLDDIKIKKSEQRKNEWKDKDLSRLDVTKDGWERLKSEFPLIKNDSKSQEIDGKFENHSKGNLKLIVFHEVRRTITNRLLRVEIKKYDFQKKSKEDDNSPDKELTNRYFWASWEEEDMVEDDWANFWVIDTLPIVARYLLVKEIEKHKRQKSDWWRWFLLGRGEEKVVNGKLYTIYRDKAISPVFFEIIIFYVFNLLTDGIATIGRKIFTKLSSRLRQLQRFQGDLVRRQMKVAADLEKIGVEMGEIREVEQFLEKSQDLMKSKNKVKGYIDEAVSKNKLADRISWESRLKQIEKEEELLNEAINKKYSSITAKICSKSSCTREERRLVNEMEKLKQELIDNEKLMKNDLFGRLRELWNKFQRFIPKGLRFIETKIRMFFVDWTEKYLGFSWLTGIVLEKIVIVVIKLIKSVFRWLGKTTGNFLTALSPLLVYFSLPFVNFTYAQFVLPN